MGGKTDTAGTFQPDFFRGKPLLAIFGYLPAQSHLVALPQTAVVMVGHVATDIDTAIMHRTDIPVLVDINIIVTGKDHDSHFRYQMKERLILVLNDDIIRKTAVMA